MGARYNWAVLAGAAGSLAAAPAYALDDGGAPGLSWQVWSLVLTAIDNGYRAAPALMLGLSFLLAVPLLVIAARLHVWSNLGPDATRRYRRRPALLSKDVSEDVSDDIAAEAVTLPGHAFVEIVGARPAEIPIRLDMLRIGREDDNDIRIPVMGVHRYHAAIHREDFGDYRITDLSGLDGNGIVVNGQRCSDARLADGDMIELGPGRLRFHAGLM